MVARIWHSPGTSGFWNTKLNWDPQPANNNSPLVNDDVTIGDSATSYTVTIDVNNTAAVGSLTIGTNATLAVGTRTLNVTGSGTDTTTATFGSHLTIAGGTINATTLAMASGSDVTGFGTIASSISATDLVRVQATGGTLEITGALANLGSSPLSLVIGSASGDTLKLDGPSSAQHRINVTFAGSSGGTLELNTLATLPVGSALDVAGNSVKLDGSGTRLTDFSGITLAGGTISGTGNVAAGTSISGYGTISIPVITGNNLTASGGILEVTGAITDAGSALSLTVGSASGDTLKLDGASAAQTLTFAGSGGTLELNTTGTLMLGSALALAANTVQLDGSGTQLTDNSGITLAGGAIGGTGNVNANISGYGTINVPLVTSNSLMATGGTLEVTGAVADAGSALSLTVGSASGDTLKLDGPISGTHTISVTFAGSGGTLELGAASLSLSSALAVAANTLKLDGSGTQLTDSLGITLAGGAISGTGNVNSKISGYGTISIPLVTGNNLTAAGGTLEVTGAITDSGNALTMAIGGASGDTLKLDGASTAQALTFAGGSGGTIELNAAGTLTLGSALALAANTVKLDGSGATLTDASGLTLSAGTLTGAGMVASDVNGYGQIMASGGTLEINGAINNTISSPLNLTIGGASGDTLKLDGPSSAQHRISVTFAGSSGGTLELGTSAQLTIGGPLGASALDVAANTLKLDGSGTQLTDVLGITLAGGTLSGTGSVSSNTNLSGYGTVSAPWDVSDTVTVSGGGLAFSGQVDPTNTTAFHIAGGAGNVLAFSAQVGTVSVHPTITFDNAANSASGEILDLTAISLSGFHGIISGFTDHTGNQSLADGIKVAGADHATLGADNVTLTVFNAAKQALGTLAFASPMTGNNFHVTNGNELVICFMPGTSIRIPGGERMVETFKPGDLVLTSDNAVVPVRWVGRQTVSRMFGDPLRVLPIRIRAGALAENTPCRDLLLSPDHAVLVGDVLVQAGALVNGTSIVRETAAPERFTYYHLELDDHSLILAEGTPAETFVDNVDRLAFDNWEEHEALYPDGKSIVEMPHPRAKSRRQVPTSMKRRLEARAAELYEALPAVA